MRVVCNGGAIGRRILIMFGVVVVDDAIAGIEEQLEQGVRVGMLGAGAHFHGEHEEPNQGQCSDELRDAWTRQSRSGELETASGQRHGDIIRGAYFVPTDRTIPRGPDWT
jgi:hypothetical protein